LRVSSAVPPGVGRLVITAHGHGAAEQIDANQVVTDLRAETIR
jgi:hypothetical protein